MPQSTHPANTQPLEHIADHLVILDTGCWTLDKKPGAVGYQLLRIDGKTVTVHRWLYQRVVEPIPAEMQLDHMCRNRACINPDHLEVVTQTENLIRGDGFAGLNARKTECLRGHEFTPANTIVRQGRPGRQCRTCTYVANAASKARTTLRSVR
jgi:hypothetical protein